MLPLRRRFRPFGCHLTPGMAGFLNIKNVADFQLNIIYIKLRLIDPKLNLNLGNNVHWHPKNNVNMLNC